MKSEYMKTQTLLNGNSGTGQHVATVSSLGKKISCNLTPKERQLIDNFCADGKSDKHFGEIRVKRYLGNLSTLQALNGTAKNIGVIQFMKSDNVWEFKTNDGEKYRYPEKLVENYADGIESLFDCEFKRIAEKTEKV